MAIEISRLPRSHQRGGEAALTVLARHSRASGPRVTIPQDRRQRSPRAGTSDTALDELAGRGPLTCSKAEICLTSPVNKAIYERARQARSMRAHASRSTSAE